MAFSLSAGISPGSATIGLPACPDQLAGNPCADRPAQSHEEAPQEPDERNVKRYGWNDQCCLLFVSRLCATCRTAFSEYTASIGPAIWHAGTSADQL
jgi:hypothetical protein